MIIEIIAKKVEKEDGDKFTKYMTVKGKTFYTVKFVKGCEAPKLYKLDNDKMRGYIDLTTESVFNKKETKRNYKGTEYTDNIIFIESYKEVDKATTEKYIEASNKKMADFKAQQEKDRLNFIAEEDDLPF